VALSPRPRRTSRSCFGWCATGAGIVRIVGFEGRIALVVGVILSWGLDMVVIRTPDGATCEYRLRQTANGLRLELRCASYDLATVLEAGWQIVGTRTYVAERLLRAGLFTSATERLPQSRRSRWRSRGLATIPVGDTILVGKSTTRAINRSRAIAPLKAYPRRRSSTDRRESDWPDQECAEHFSSTRDVARQQPAPIHQFRPKPPLKVRAGHMSHDRVMVGEVAAQVAHVAPGALLTALAEHRADRHGRCLRRVDRTRLSQARVRVRSPRALRPAAGDSVPSAPAQSPVQLQTVVGCRAAA